MIIKELTNEEFEIFSESFPISSVYQTVGYALTMNKEGYSTIYVGLLDNNKIVAASLFLIKKDGKFKYAYAPRGFLIDYNNYELVKIYTEGIKNYFSRIGITGIKLCPIIIKSVYNTNTDEKIENKYFESSFNNLLNLDYYHFGFNNNFEALKPRYEAIIDLRKPTDYLFNNIDKSYRTKIRSAENKGIEIIEGNDKNISILYDLAKKKYPRNLSYYENLYKYFDRNSDIDIYFAKLNTNKYLQAVQEEYNKVDELLNKYNDAIIRNHNSKKINMKLDLDQKHNRLKEELTYAIKLLKDYEDGIILASALIVKHSDTAYLMIDGYDSKYKKMNAKHLLIWKLINRYSKEGFKKFNLGGISNTEGTDKYKGLTEFKCNFGANIVEYAGDLELVTNNTLYFMYRKMKPIKNMFHKKKKEN